MEETAAAISEILADYHNYNHFKFTPEHIVDWAAQFDEADRAFILEEFHHILSQNIYVSEKLASQLLMRRVEGLARIYGFKDPMSFIASAEFPLMQDGGKSQDVLLQLLDKTLVEKYGVGLSAAGSAGKKHVVYIDDILATGGTVFKHTLAWLKQTDDQQPTNLEQLVKGEKTFDICVFCCHNANTVKWRLKLECKEDKLIKKIGLFSDYTIDDHRSFLDQRRNFVFPLRDATETAFDEYLGSLDDLPYNMKEVGAYRDQNSPKEETLFSNLDNRKRFEHILLRKGIHILAGTAKLAESQRPLGMTMPSYKSFGSGTLFFTWRNISNTCPVVFWWDKGGWKPLFPVINRGLHN